MIENLSEVDTPEPDEFYKKIYENERWRTRLISNGKKDSFKIFITSINTNIGAIK